MAAARLPDPALPWPISRPAVALIAEREGCRLRAYLCPAGVWTCGWGETDGVGPNTAWTQAFADQRFCDSLTERTEAVRALCTREPTPQQLGAMVSLAYNIGMGWAGRVKPAGAKDGFRQSTVLRQHNAGNHAAAARAFNLWNKTRDPKTKQLVELPGLTSRRVAEAALYLQPHVDDQPQPMPQVVQPESKPAAGPVAASGITVAGAGGLIASLGPLGEQLGAVKAALAAARGVLVDTLGVPPDWILPLLLIGAGAVIVRYRYLQRREGWA